MVIVTVVFHCCQHHWAGLALYRLFVYQAELKVKEDKIIELEAQHETDSRLWLDEYEGAY